MYEYVFFKENESNSSKIYQERDKQICLKIMTNGLNFENEFNEVKEGKLNSI